MAEPLRPGVPTRVNPYSVIDITPLHEDQPPPPDPEAEGEGGGLHVPSGYSVPVPCGYAVPSSLPLLLPAYSSPALTPAGPAGSAATPVPHLAGRRGWGGGQKVLSISQGRLHTWGVCVRVHACVAGTLRTRERGRSRENQEVPQEAGQVQGACPRTCDIGCRGPGC